MKRGELYWSIFSYLIHNEILIIEDRFYGYNINRTEKYEKRTSYFNPIEINVYNPILESCEKSSIRQSQEEG